MAHTEVGTMMMTMRRVAPTCLLLTMGLTLAPAGQASAQDASMVREEVARTVATAGEKLVALAEAMPEEAYRWRPAEGVRSVSEVYMHVAGTNYWFPTMLGGQPPASSGVTSAYRTVPPMEAVTDKAAVVAALRDSFEFLVDFIREAPANRLNEPINMFGTATTYRGVLVETTIHLHEHLGQSIAYARTNGVVPPWSG
jgi:uncharacterized damage-inducible protein DinB